MRLKARRYLAMVAVTGSFSATARHFSVPTSSVSRFVATLERKIGQQSLYRNNRAVNLTGVGERSYVFIREALELLDAAAKRLVQVTYEVMWKGIRAVRPGASLGDVAHAIEKHAKKNGYTVVRNYSGHGIGREMHEPPQVLHFGRPRTGLVLREGMVFTIEPMLNAGRAAVKTLGDGWTAVTCDGALSAQFEHTVAATDRGVRSLL